MVKRLIDNVSAIQPARLAIRGTNIPSAVGDINDPKELLKLIRQNAEAVEVIKQVLLQMAAALEAD